MTKAKLIVLEMNEDGVCSMMTNSTDDQNVLLLTSAILECTSFRHLIEQATRHALAIEEKRMKDGLNGRTKN